MRCTANVTAADVSSGAVVCVADARRAPGGALTVPALEGSMMDTPRRAGQRALAIMVALAAVLAVASVPSATPAFAQGTVTLEWFGWSHFRLTSVAGKIIHINPFTTNPDTTVSVDDINTVDLILAADGHPDELGQTVDIAKKTGAMTFVAGGGLNGWMLEQGLPMGQVAQRFAQP